MDRYTVWTKVKGAGWVDQGTMGYVEAKAEVEARRVQYNPDVIRVTFLPVGTDPKRLG